MNKITLSWYIKTIRKYSKNHRESYQSILNKLFELICGRKNFYYIESSASSRIMNGEYDVPFAIRCEFNNKTDEEKAKISNSFINQMIDISSFDELATEIKEYINGSTISLNIKGDSLNETNYYLFSLILSISIINDNRIMLNKTLYRSNTGEINIMLGDIISIGFNKKIATSKRIVVIPVDSNFTMSFKDSHGNDTISKDSLHGKWLSRINKMDIGNPKINFSNINDSFKIGKVVINQTEFYLIPISTLTNRNMAESSYETLCAALGYLAYEYNVAGQGIDIYIPLIGTGRSRINISINNSINLIANSFSKNKYGLFGKVNIVIYRKLANLSEELL